MSALVYDCDEKIRAAIESLRENGADDEEILRALLKAADDIRHKNWGGPEW